MTIIAFLDCSFAFYANLPPRLTTTELRCDLPCDNTVFKAAHPFSVTKFTPCRGSTINEKFQQFFEPECHPVAGGLDPKTTVLNVQDMFLVAYCMCTLLRLHMTVQLTIPVLFVCVHVHVTHANPMSRSRLLSSASLPSTTGSPSNWNFAPVKFALARWKYLWFSIRANYTEEDWAKIGFFKNAYSYWLMTQLIVSQKGGAEVLMRMDVPCEDTLAQYR